MQPCQDEEKPVACTQTIELLLANKGKQAKVELQDKAVHTGVIHEVLVERTPTAVTPVLASLFAAARPPRRAVPGDAEAREAGPPPCRETCSGCGPTKAT
jgi:hypothetical protein